MAKARGFSDERQDAERRAGCPPERAGVRMDGQPTCDWSGPRLLYPLAACPAERRAHATGCAQCTGPRATPHGVSARAPTGSRARVFEQRNRRGQFTTCLKAGALWPQNGRPLRELCSAVATTSRIATCHAMGKSWLPCSSLKRPTTLSCLRLNSPGSCFLRFILVHGGLSSPVTSTRLPLFGGREPGGCVRRCVDATTVYLPSRGEDWAATPAPLARSLEEAVGMIAGVPASRINVLKAATSVSITSRKRWSCAAARAEGSSKTSRDWRVGSAWPPETTAAGARTLSLTV